MDGTPTPPPLQDLLERLRLAREASAADPFGDPVLLLALAISRRLDDGAMDLGAVGNMSRPWPMTPPPAAPPALPPISATPRARTRPRR